MTNFNRLDSLDAKGKTVLLRVDLNVPMMAGRVTDITRIERIKPTIKYLSKQGAKIVLLSHFGRPNGKYEPSMSLAPLVDSLQELLTGIYVNFCPNCVGLEAEAAIDNTPEGSVVLMENLRFHWQEEAGSDDFAKQIASLADAYVNDAFSCSHRSHSSISFIPKFLPTYVGLAMQREIEILTEMFDAPEKPIGAIVGGSKISSKLELLENLMEKADKLFIGGAMANTLLYAEGYDMGASLCEHDMKHIAKGIIEKSRDTGCQLYLPTDLVVAIALDKQAPCKIVPVNAVLSASMSLDIGPQTLFDWAAAVKKCKTIVWNGPVGAFETSPFDASTVMLARVVGKATADGLMKSVAGGGDTLAAINHAGMRDEFSYLSTAGGAFLEWLEGKQLPGVEALSARVA